MKIIFSLILVLMFLCCSRDKSPSEPSSILFNGDNTWILRKNWRQCSPPKRLSPNPSLSDMGRIAWFNPQKKVYASEIWPTIQKSLLAETMTLFFMPSNESLRAKDSWGGIMRTVPPQFNDLSQKHFLSLWCKGDQGIINIDLGDISEDIIPNYSLDTEDRFVEGVRNGILDKGENIGLDGMADNDPRAIAAGGDFWDLNRNGQKEPGEPFSMDNWSDYTSADHNFTQINGTENNAKDTNGKTPDSEDMNNNGDVDLANDFCRYTFSLEKTSPDTIHIQGKAKSQQWNLYQISLEEDIHAVYLLGQMTATLPKVDYRIPKPYFGIKNKRGRLWPRKIYC